MKKPKLFNQQLNFSMLWNLSKLAGKLIIHNSFIIETLLLIKQKCHKENNDLLIVIDIKFKHRKVIRLILSNNTYNYFTK